MRSVTGIRVQGPVGRRACACQAPSARLAPMPCWTGTRPLRRFRSRRHPSLRESWRRCTARCTTRSTRSSRATTPIASRSRRRQGLRRTPLRRPPRTACSSALVPAQKAALDAALAQSLAKIGDERSKADGVAVGKAAAERMLAWRAKDNFDAKAEDKPGTGAGVWQRTPPGLAPGALPQLGGVTPFIAQVGRSVRGEGPAGADEPGVRTRSRRDQAPGRSPQHRAHGGANRRGGLLGGQRDSAAECRRARRVAGAGSCRCTTTPASSRCCTPPLPTR